MFGLVTFVLAGLLAVLAPRFGVDSRPGFPKQPTHGPHGV